MITLQKIAELANVSKASASYAFSENPRKREKISEGTRERILGIAERLGYHPSLSGRGLAMSRSYSLGLLLPKKNVQSFSPHFMGMFHGVADAISKSDYNLPLYFGWNEKLEGNLSQRRLDGLLVVSRLLESPVFGELRRLEIPVLCLNRRSCGGRCMSVMTDMNGWVRAGLERFLARGYRQAVLYSRDPVNLAMDEGLSSSFPGLCAAYGMTGEARKLESFDGTGPDDAALFFRGDGVALRRWFSSAPKAAERSAVFCSPQVCLEEGYPLDCCSYHDSGKLGEVGALTLIQAVEKRDIPRDLLLPCLAATDYHPRTNTIMEEF